MRRPTIEGRLRRRASATLAAGTLGGLAALVAPDAVAAHQLTGRFTSPIPLGAYLVGAALAVGASFAIVFLRDGRTQAVAVSGSGAGVERFVRVPAALRTGLTGLGVVAWVWIVVAAVIVAGHTDADTASLFLWTYGWVGLALVSAFIGPVWLWLDPFASLHRMLASLARRLGVEGGSPAPYPARLGRWPAVIGFAVFVWFELAMPATRSGRALGLVLVGYTVVTLVAMAQFGRETWRRNGEVFSVWFDLVGRLAPLAAAEAERPRRLRVRTFASGLLGEDGLRLELAELALVASATGAILFDGLSQTQIYFDWFGIPTIPAQTVLLAGWLGLIVGLAIGVSRLVGVRPLVAGLIPIAIGYLIAHYFTFILFDSQRIVPVLTDPLGLGWDLLGVGEFEPASGWLPGAVAWSLQLVAVVSGHVIGAWAGHSVAVREAGGSAGRAMPGAERAIRRRQIPLALLMVGLTTLTLWSLGQAIVQTSEPTALLARLTGG